MGSNGPKDAFMHTADETEDSVEIKIRTLDCETYTLRVNKFVPVPALKEQIATVTGVLSEQQRLICRGKVLRDDQLLSAYHVEDGHTLHLVSRPPNLSSSAPLATSMESEGAAAFTSASSSDQTRGSPVSHSFVFEAVNIDPGDRSSPTLGRFLSSLLQSIANAGTGNATVDFREMGSERSGGANSNVGLSDAAHPQPSSVAHSGESNRRHASFVVPSTLNRGVQHPSVIPDSLTTINQYLGYMRDEFLRLTSADGALFDNVQSYGSHVNEGENHSFQSRPDSVLGGLPTPSYLAELMLSARELLIQQAGGRLSQLARQLENQERMTDPSVRANVQSSAVRSGLFLLNLGSLLLELGRTTMTLRMGQNPTEAVVNAGPAVFISSSGPNPMMVQPVPFYPGSSFGGLHIGTANPGHEGHTVADATANLGEQAGVQQAPEQADSARNTPGPNFIHQAFSGASEPGVRVVPVRTVVAVPATVSRPATDSSGRPTGLFYPLFARVQRQRGPQSSTGPNSAGPEIDQRPIPESSMPSRDGSHLPTNPTLVLSGTSSTTSESAPYQGPPQVFVSSQIPPVAVTAGSHDGQQSGQGSMAQMLSRFDQWLRGVLTGEEANASDSNGGQDPPATASATNQADTIRNSEAQVSSMVGDDQAVFFSSLVRQLMPHISQDTDTDTTTPSRAQMEEITGESSRSRHPRDPPESPSSKRLKRN